MKYFIIYMIIGLIYGMIFVRKALNEVKQNHEGQRDIMSQVVQDYADSQIIYLVILAIITFTYPISMFTKLRKLILKKG